MSRIRVYRDGKPDWQDEGRAHSHVKGLMYGSSLGGSLLWMTDLSSTTDDEAEAKRREQLREAAKRGRERQREGRR